MPIKECIQAIEELNKKGEPQPNEEVRKTLIKSGIGKFMDELAAYVEPNSQTVKEVQEDGNRIYIEFIWPIDDKLGYNRLVVSVRKNTIKFMGGQDQFIELAGQDVVVEDLVEDSLARTFLNPQRINKSRYE